MILQKIYNNFSSVADNIANWRSLSKNELVNLYIDNESNETLRESYIAAIFCRYWNAINNYYRTSKNSVCVEDCFEWLSHAILYALKHRKWRDPKNPLYTDPSAPDKVINRCIASTRKIFYQSNNNDNRKINFGLDSIEKIEEDKLSYILPSEKSFEIDCLDSITYKKIIIDKFQNNSIQALVIDGILNGDVFEHNKEERYVTFSRRKLARHLKNLDYKYIKHISNLYNIEEQKITETSIEIKKMLGTKLYKIIDYTLVSLSKVVDNDRER